MLRYDVSYTLAGVRFCLPTGTDRSCLIDVTRVGDTWARFINERAGEEIDCAVHAAKMMRRPNGNATNPTELK